MNEVSPHPDPQINAIWQRLAENVAAERTASEAAKRAASEWVPDPDPLPELPRMSWRDQADRRLGVAVAAALTATNDAWPAEASAAKQFDFAAEMVRHFREACVDPHSMVTAAADHLDACLTVLRVMEEPDFTAFHSRLWLVAGRLRSGDPDDPQGIDRWPLQLSDDER